MSTRRLGELWRHVATPASSAATTAIEEPEPPAMAAEIEQFRDTGVVVLRGLLSSEEMDRLKGPHVQAYENLDYDGRDQLKDPTKTYPAPGVYSMGPRILDVHPDCAAVSCGHPRIVAAIEALFGEPAVLAQYWSIMRPEGAGVPTTGEAFVPGKGAHYDYKPWRTVGSFVKWMFCIIPFVDYTPDAGPCAAVPGSYHKTTILPSDGRVHQVDAGQVPVADEVGPTLVDPELRRGDVLLMHGFTWHEAWPNNGQSDRCGLYMKFHAKSSPPACGPTIYPSAANEYLGQHVPETQHIMPYHRADGNFAQVSPESGDHHGVDEARFLIENPEGKVLLVPRGADSWSFPCYAAADDPGASILDVCNVVGAGTAAAAQHIGIELPWVSWITDLPATTAATAPEFAEQRCRVFAHRLTPSKAAAAAESEEVKFAGGRWVSPEELAGVEEAGELECDGQEVSWLRAWREEADLEGSAVTRSYGVPSRRVADYVYNQAGNPAGHYRVGVFDEEGRPLPKGFERT